VVKNIKQDRILLKSVIKEHQLITQDRYLFLSNA